MTGLTDTHCHLTCDELYEDASAVIARAKEAGVDSMMIMCTSPTELERAFPIRECDPNTFRVAFGWFPEDASWVSDKELAYLEQLAAEHKIDVLGEIGLDYHFDTSFKEKQKDLMIRQIEIANRYGLPIAIHMRDASKDCMDILKTYAKTPIIFHCYSGSTETMKEALKLNSMISFAGTVTFKNNKQGPANVMACPADRILSETDAPFLAPVPKRGKRNEPAYVQYTVEKMAELKEMDPEDLKKQIRFNFNSLFQ